MHVVSVTHVLTVHRAIYLTDTLLCKNFELSGVEVVWREDVDIFITLTMSHIPSCVSSFYLADPGTMSQRA